MNTPFCAVPAFIRVEPAINSRPVSTNIGNFAASHQCGAGIVGDTDRDRTRRRLLVARRYREWRRPAGGDRNHHVVRGEPRGIDLPDGVVASVLRALDAGDKRAVAAGDDEVPRCLLDAAKVGSPRRRPGRPPWPEVPAPTYTMRPRSPSAAFKCSRRPGDGRQRVPDRRDRRKLALPHGFHRGRQPTMHQDRQSGGRFPLWPSGS